jgi:hypothetical protein
MKNRAESGISNIPQLGPKVNQNECVLASKILNLSIANVNKLHLPLQK